MRLRRQKSGRGRYSPTAGLGFDDQEFESRIVWIWCTARSGSTWFLRMLSHPLKLVDSSEDPEDRLGFVTPRTWQGQVDVIPVDTTFVSNHLLPLHGNADYTESLAPRTYASALGLRNRANYFFSVKYEDVWRPEMRRMMLVRFHRFAERAAERYDVSSPLILLKEVAGAHAAPLVMSMFPRSKMIFLIRDGRDVVDSQTAANQPGGWLPVTGWETPEERAEFIRRRARTWVGDVTAIERAYRAHPEDLRRMVRYEDLRTDPAGTLRPLVEWLDLRRGDTWLERTVAINSFDAVAPEQKGPKKFFRSATPGAWRNNMTNEEAASLNEIMGEKLPGFGYSVGDAPPAAYPKGEPDGNPGRSGGEALFPKRDVVSKSVSRAGEGRDYSGVVRLVHRRGTPAARRARKIALTFDDGPVLQTYRVIEALERHGARGTFFLVGRKIDGQERLVKRLVSGGHEIGNHSYGHAPFPPTEDVAACNAVIEHVSGIRPKVFRPPFGAVDRRIAEAAIDRGMRVIMWSVDSDDAVPPFRGTSAEKITGRILEHVFPGAIVLLHDGLPWSRAADALPNLVERLVGDGYQLVTVSELLAGGGQRPAGGGRIVRRLRRVRDRARKREPVAPDTAPRQSENGSESSGVDGRARLLGVLEELTDYVEPPEPDEPATELIRGTRTGLLGSGTDSELLARHTAAYDGSSLLVVSLGFAVRRFEGERHEAAGLGEELDARLRGAEGPGAEARLIAEELAGPRRHMRLITAHLAGQAAATKDVEAGLPISGAPDPPIDAPHSARPDFLAIFAPGTDVWQELESWARATGRSVARKRNRALLDAAGVDGDFDIEPIVDRLDVDFLFRFGYALAACEEVLSPTRS